MKSIVLCERTLVQESENFSTLKDEILNEESNEKEEEKKVLNGIPDSRKSASDVENTKKDGVSLQNGDKSSGISFEEDVSRDERKDEVDEKDWESMVESDNRVDESVLTSETDNIEEVAKISVCRTRDETDFCETLTSEDKVLENLETQCSGENEDVNGDLEESVEIIEEEKSDSSPQHTGNVEEKELKMESEERVQQMEDIILEMDENKENEKEEKAHGLDVFSGNNLKKLSSGCEIQVGEVQTISGAEKDSIWAESDFKKCVEDSKEKSDEKVTCDYSGDGVSNDESVNIAGDDKEDGSLDLTCDENVISEDEDMRIEVDESERTAEAKVEEKESHLTELDKSANVDDDRRSRSGTHEKPKSAICRKRQKPEGSIEEDPSIKKKRLLEGKEDREQMLSEEENTGDSSRCESIASLDSTGVSTKDQTLAKAKPRTTKRASTIEENEKKSKASVGDEESEVKKHKTTETRFSVLEKFRGTLKTLTRSDLEELIVQKLCEVITERSNVGELRRKAQALEENQERWKAKALSLSKQMREMEMVMKKYMAEVQKQVKEGESHMVTPLKVTRSVGLQVSFYTSGSKIVKTNIPQPSPNAPQNLNSRTVKPTPPKVPSQYSPTNTNLRNKPSPSFQKGSTSVQKSPVSQQRRPIVPKPDYTSTPISRPVPQQSPVGNTRVSNQVQALRSNFKSVVGTSPQQQPQQSQSHPQQQIPQSQQQQQQQNGSKVIDLTDDDDRQTGNVVVKSSGPIRVVNHLPQPSPTSQNNRFAYLLPTTSASTATPTGQNRQVLIATPTMPQPNRQIMCSMPPLLFKGGNVVQSGSQPQMINQSNKVILPKLLRHPAPLPKRPINQNTRPSLKLIPPRPALKISKVQTGIVLSWNMELSQEHAPIASYQLYAYQESDSPPATSLWKKVGDVKALPLPMACTLTQFMSGHKYHFAVRAVDLHSRIGPFSFPGTIVLV